MDDGERGLMYEIIDKERNRKLFSKAVRLAQASSFRAECKMAFPAIDGILVRASSLMCVQQRDNEPYLNFFLKEMRKAYRSGNDKWFERRITMRMLYEHLLKDIKRHALDSACYEIVLSEGRTWAFLSHGPLVNWFDCVQSVSAKKTKERVSEEEGRAIMQFLLKEDDLRMLDLSVKQKLKGVEA